MLQHWSLPWALRVVGIAALTANLMATALIRDRNAVVRPKIGLASDRFGRFNVSAGLTFVCGLCCFVVWIPATSYGATLLFAIVSGAILGVFWVVSTVYIPNKQVPCLMALDYWSSVCRNCRIEGVTITDGSHVAHYSVANHMYVLALHV